MKGNHMPLRIGLGWWALLLLALWASYSQAQTCTQQSLHAEFYEDVTQRGYSTCSTDGDLSNSGTTSDTCVLDRFNAPCTNHANCKVPNILSREDILQTIIDPTDLETLARSTNANDVARKSELDWLMAAQTWDMSKAHNQQLWKNVFPSSFTTTNTAINNAQLKDAPRSQIVCHRPGTLTDVSCGLRGDGCP